eukprot:c4917_g1_i1.p1 GENE.c4917_g1_i1~~c4917_g1_i1.p1  ORF type:complete len:156 (-),score=42.75 c4917_g1_i1:80-508(-)
MVKPEQKKVAASKVADEPVETAATIKNRSRPKFKNNEDGEGKKKAKEGGGLNWKALAFLLLVILPGLLGAVFGAIDYIGKTSWGAKLGLSPTPQKVQSPRQKLTEFYRLHNPAKIGEVDKLLKKYKGREEEMFQVLREKYNV